MVIGTARPSPPTRGSGKIIPQNKPIALNTRALWLSSLPGLHPQLWNPSSLYFSVARTMMTAPPDLWGHPCLSPLPSSHGPPLTVQVWPHPIPPPSGPSPAHHHRAQLMKNSKYSSIGVSLAGGWEEESTRKLQRPQTLTRVISSHPIQVETWGYNLGDHHFGLLNGETESRGG